MRSCFVFGKERDCIYQSVLVLFFALRPRAFSHTPSFVKSLIQWKHLWKCSPTFTAPSSSLTLTIRWAGATPSTSCPCSFSGIFCQFNQFWFKSNCIIAQLYIQPNLHSSMDIWCFSFLLQILRQRERLNRLLSSVRKFEFDEIPFKMLRSWKKVSLSEEVRQRLEKWVYRYWWNLLQKLALMRYSEIQRCRTPFWMTIKI